MLKAGLPRKRQPGQPVANRQEEIIAEESKPMKIKVNDTIYDLSGASHMEIEIEGERYSITPNYDGSIVLRVITTMGTGMIIEPQAGNAIRVRGR